MVHEKCRSIGQQAAADAPNADFVPVNVAMGHGQNAGGYECEENQLHTNAENESLLATPYQTQGQEFSPPFDGPIVTDEEVEFTSVTFLGFAIQVSQVSLKSRKARKHGNIIRAERTLRVDSPNSIK